MPHQHPRNSLPPQPPTTPSPDHLAASRRNFVKSKLSENFMHGFVQRDLGAETIMRKYVWALAWEHGNSDGKNDGRDRSKLRL